MFVILYSFSVLDLHGRSAHALLDMAQAEAADFNLNQQKLHSHWKSGWQVQSVNVEQYPNGSAMHYFQVVGEFR